MLMFCFFMAVFSSTSWLIYALMFIDSKLAEARLWEQNVEQLLLMLAVVFIPIFSIWMIFGFINQFLSNKNFNFKQNEILKQLQKNQDYTDLVVRVMLDAEHEIKDGFVLNKFDLFVSDMNEALSEIIQRCNIASSSQLEQLWQRVKRGERWVLGKAILDASKSQSTFDAWVREKVNRDKVFRGTLLEFCSRYQNLLQLLEKHDRDRIFLRIIESGVFGKVYSIIAPLSEGLNTLSVSPEDKAPQSKQERDYSSVLKIATMEEPSAPETIVNVDKNDDEDNSFEQPKQSFFAKLNPFGRKNIEIEEDEHEQDPFFRALHNSFKDENDSDFAAHDASPSFDTGFSSPTTSSENFTAQQSASSSENTISLDGDYFDKKENRITPTFGNAKNTLDNLRDSNYSLSTKASVKTQPIEPSLNSVSGNSFTESQQKLSQKDEEKDEDLAYPFGGWTDEENYR